MNKRFLWQTSTTNGAFIFSISGFHYICLVHCQSPHWNHQLAWSLAAPESISSESPLCDTRLGTECILKESRGVPSGELCSGVLLTEGIIQSSAVKFGVTRISVSPDSIGLIDKKKIRNLYSSRSLRGYFEEIWNVSLNETDWLIG